MNEREREVEMNQGGDQGGNGPVNQRPGNFRPGTGPNLGNQPPKRGKIMKQVFAGAWAFGQPASTSRQQNQNESR